MKAYHPTSHTLITGRTLSGIAKQLARTLKIDGRSTARFSGGSRLGESAWVYTLVTQGTRGWNAHGDVVVTRS